jgi:hydroxymethylpyrimidine/phosphomethylpyrimidine kinase
MDLPRALSIAGSDSSGGAGIQADLKAFSALGVFGMSAITAITAQNTCGVNAVQTIDCDIIAGQIDAVFADIRVDAVKIGMLANAEIIRCVAARLRHWRPSFVVLDPVMVSKSGSHLLQEDAVSALREELLPLAQLVTPNLPEAAVLCGRAVVSQDDMLAAAREICGFGAAAALIKGGHSQEHANDLLYDGHEARWLLGERINSRNTHGTGCTLSAAIAAEVAKKQPLLAACEQAKAYVRSAMTAGLDIGEGCGPLHHFFAWY